MPSSTYEFAEAPSTSNGTEPSTLLLVGPNASLQNEWKERLSATHWTIREARSGAEAWESLLEESCELMLLDPDLPDLDGAEFERMVRAQFPSLQIIILAPPSGTSSPATISTTSAPRTAASHTRLLLRPESTSHANPGFIATIGAQPSWYELVGGSAGMQRVYHAAGLVARRSTTVLIQGESSRSS